MRFSFSRGSPELIIPSSDRHKRVCCEREVVRRNGRRVRCRRKRPASRGCVTCRASASRARRCGRLAHPAEVARHVATFSGCSIHSLCAMPPAVSFLLSSRSCDSFFTSKTACIRTKLVNSVTEEVSHTFSHHPDRLCLSVVLPADWIHQGAATFTRLPIPLSPASCCPGLPCCTVCAVLYCTPLHCTVLCLLLTFSHVLQVPHLLLRQRLSPGPPRWPPPAAWRP